MISKYGIFTVIFFGYAVFGYNRKGVSFTIPKLLEEGMGKEEIGMILSSQNLAYAISKFMGGIISDKLSARILFSIGLFISGLAVILFSLLDSVPFFALAWFLNGLAQGVGWPAIAKLLKNWFEPGELGTWWSAASASANVSGCVGPFVATYIISNYGWRSSLSLCGSVTIASSAISYLFIADAPNKAGAIGHSSRKNIKSSKGTIKDSTERPKVSPKKVVKGDKRSGALMLLLKKRIIWVVSACYLVVSSIKTSLTDWSTTYLISECGQSQLAANSFVSSVELGGFFGGLAAGYLSDLYLKRCLANKKANSNPGQPRMTVAIAFASVTLVCLQLLYNNVNETTSTLFLNQLGIWLGASVYGQIAIFGVVATQCVASEISGTAHAIAALAANIGSIAAGLPFATFAKYYSWSHVFFTLQMMTVSTVAFMLTNIL